MAEFKLNYMFKVWVSVQVGAKNIDEAVEEGKRRVKHLGKPRIAGVQVEDYDLRFTGVEFDGGTNPYLDSEFD